MKCEFNQYIKCDVIERKADVLEWWLEHRVDFPNLAILARKYLAIPATEASSERLFSAAGNVLTDRRSKMSSDSLEQLVFLHEFLKV